MCLFSTFSIKETKIKKNNVDLRLFWAKLEATKNGRCHGFEPVHIIQPVGRFDWRKKAGDSEKDLCLFDWN